MRQSDAEKCAQELTGHVSKLVAALEAIGQGYAFYGSERRQIDAEDMRVIALKALGKR